MFDKKEYARDWARKRRADPEYRARINAQNRERYAAGHPKSRGKWDKSRPDYAEMRHAYERDYRRKNYLKYMITSTKFGAAKRGLEHAITETDLNQPSHCPVLGIALDWSCAGKRHDGTPTVDRIDNSRGYVPGNIEVVSWLANRVKSNCNDPSVFEAVAKHMRERC